MKILNSAVGRFVEPDASPQLQALRAQPLTMRGMKGAVLLASESIDFSPASDSAAIHEFLAWLRLDRRLQVLGTGEDRLGCC